MAALLEVPSRLGCAAEGYMWLRWPTGEGGSNSDKVFTKYKAWLGDIESQTWVQLLATCDAGATFPVSGTTVQTCGACIQGKPPLVQIRAQLCRVPCW
jgi:hypothetical protein